MIWLKENECPWQLEENIYFLRKKTFSSASENGNLEKRKWLKENGCPWNEVPFAYAAQNMKWLKETVVLGMNILFLNLWKMEI